MLLSVLQLVPASHQGLETLDCTILLSEGGEKKFYSNCIVESFSLLLLVCFFKIALSQLRIDCLTCNLCSLLSPSIPHVCLWF